MGEGAPKLMADYAALYPTLTFDRPADGVLRITLDGPGLNAVSQEGHLHLADVWLTIDRDPDVTRLLDRLEKRGLVKRLRSRTDRRVVEIGITAKGLQVVGGLDPQAQRMPKALLGHLGPDRLRQLTRLLETIITELGSFP